MIKFRRPSKRTITIIVLVLVIIGTWFYQVLYSTPGEALRRAENFLFTRQTVARLADQDAVRYFFVTNRRKSAEEMEDPEERFTNVREPGIRFGRFDATIEPSIGLGMLINPSEWFQTEEIRVNSLELVSREDFVEELGGIVDRSPMRSVILLINGFRERFPSALRKTVFVGHILDINSPVMVFDWPGDQGSTPRGYRRAHTISRESGLELADTIKLLVRDINPDKLWIIANSMGGQVVVDAFSHLYKDPEYSDAGIEIEDVILTAPDVSREAFNTQFKTEIASMTRNLTVYVSSNDRALVMSRIINFGESRRGESTLEADMLEEAAAVVDMMDPDDELVTLVDVTPVNRTRNFHNFSLETPEFFDDLFLRMVNKKTPDSRGLYHLQTPDGTGYWVLTPGR